MAASCSSEEISSRNMKRTGGGKNLHEIREQGLMLVSDTVLSGWMINHSNGITEIVNSAHDSTGKLHDKVILYLDKNSESTVSNDNMDVVRAMSDQATNERNTYQRVTSESLATDELSQNLSSLPSITGKEQTQHQIMLDGRNSDSHLDTSQGGIIMKEKCRGKASNSPDKTINNNSMKIGNEGSIVGENQKPDPVKLGAIEMASSNTSSSEVVYRLQNSVISFEGDDLDLEPRIVGGEEASIQEFPFMASLRRQDCCHHCGSVLVSSSWLLTAGHCLLTPTGDSLILSEPRGWFIIAGVSVITDNRTERCGKGMERRDVVQMMLHPHFELMRLLHDLGMMRVHPAFRLRKEIMPARLPSAEMFPEEDFSTGTSCVLAGFGHVSPVDEQQVVMRGIDRRSWSTCNVDGRSFWLPHLQKVYLHLLYYKECIKTYYNWVGGITEQASLCTFSMHQKGTCHGDAGCPLICRNITVGIVSWGSGHCSRERKPGVYARVDLSVGWIQHTLLTVPTTRAGAARTQPAAVKLISVALVATVTQL